MVRCNQEPKIPKPDIVVHGQKHSDNLQVESATRGRLHLLLRQVWGAFRDLSDIGICGALTQEDADLWMMVTKHSAIQSLLKSKIKEDR